MMRFGLNGWIDEYMDRWLIEWMDDVYSFDGMDAQNSKNVWMMNGRIV